MLPDFSRAKTEIRKKFNEFLKQKIAFHGPEFAEVQERIIHEGTGTTVDNQDSDFEHGMDLEKIEVGESINIDTLIANPLLAFDLLDKMAQQVALDKGMIMLEAVSKVTEKTGNKSLRPGKITPETLLEMFEKIAISFNEDGTPQMPKIYLGPHLVPEAEHALQQFEENPVYKKKYEDLINRKKTEWNDRENNRKLGG